MNKVEIIVRRIFGWSLNSSGEWFDLENNRLIPRSNFQPDKNIDEAMQIVERLQKFGYTYTLKGSYEVSFNDVSETGDTLAEAITNAAFSLVEVSAISDDWL